MSTPSDTPRTDLHVQGNWAENFVTTQFAQGLERELNAAHQRTADELNAQQRLHVMETARLTQERDDALAELKRYKDRLHEEYARVRELEENEKRFKFESGSIIRDLTAQVEELGEKLNKDALSEIRELKRTNGEIMDALRIQNARVHELAGELQEAKEQASEDKMHGQFYATENQGLLTKLRRLERAQPPAQQYLDRPQWMPIETAPMDGTRVLLYDPMSSGLQFIGYWDARFESEWDEEKDDWKYTGAWTANEVESFAYEELATLRPTHWMATPPPPPSKEGEG